MSSSDDASSRLSSALDEIFAQGGPKLPPRDGDRDTPSEEEPSADWSVDDEPVEPSADWSVDDEPVEPSADWSVDDEPVESSAVDDTAEHRVDGEEAPVAAGQGSGNGTPATGATAAGPATEPFVLPEIVPATEEPPPPRPEQPQPELRPELRPADRPPATAPPAPPARPATGWGDHLAPAGTTSGSTALRAPGRRPRVRRVTRVVRHIDPWSTFKVAVLFSAVAYVVGLTAGVLLWRVADRTGTLDNIERWFTQFGWETFELDGGEIFHNAWIIGLFGVVALTGAIVLLATLFNLVSDIVGGIRVSVLEEEVVERTISSTRRYVVRRPPLGDADGTAAGQQWDVDGDEPATESIGEPVSAAPTGDGPPPADWSVDDEDGDDDEATAGRGAG